jgi:signal transduction histidine kinase/ActR/RegA family two-component response regulator
MADDRAPATAYRRSTFAMGFAMGGEMGSRMCDLDWSKTPVGHPDTWPDELRVAVQMALVSRSPVVVFWGPHLCMLYNDAYVPFLGEGRHPRALGMPGPEGGPEIWDRMGAAIESVLRTGKAVWSDDEPHACVRNGRREEVFATRAVAPLLSSDGGSVRGILCPFTETTEQVVGARRMETLRRLGEDVGVESVDALGARIAAILGDNPFDIAFAAFYEVDESSARAERGWLVGVPSLDASPLPAVLDLAAAEDRWRVASVVRSRASEEVGVGDGAPLPGGAWPEPSTRAVVLPLFTAARERVSGVVVLGASPRRPLDAPYRTFLELVAGRVGTAIGDARASERSRKREDALTEATAARSEAEAANRTTDDFLATLGHELRTPLAAIRLWAAALRSGALSLSEIGRGIEAIAQSAEEESRLIDDLLDSSRLSSGNLLLACCAVEVRALVESAVETVKPVALAKAVALSMDIDAGAGAAVLDGPRMKQVLWNLLTNAVKFTPPGGSVSVRARRREGQLEFEVVDSGEGIAPEHLAHVFERSRQAGMRETRGHGLGIGLGLAKQLVELHGGHIEARSEGIGRGATFRVRLPAAEPAADPRSSGLLPAATDADEAPLSAVRVLLVEDDAPTRDAMQWTLERSGAVVTAVGSATDALDALDDEGAPYVILSDLGLPAMSGLEMIERVIERFRTRGRHPPPSCAVSAHARDADRRQAIDRGFDMYLAKPVTPERLLQAVVDLRDILAANGG